MLVSPAEFAGFPTIESVCRTLHRAALWKLGETGKTVWILEVFQGDRQSYVGRLKQHDQPLNASRWWGGGEYRGMFWGRRSRFWSQTYLLIF